MVWRLGGRVSLVTNVTNAGDLVPDVLLVRRLSL